MLRELVPSVPDGLLGRVEEVEPPGSIPVSEVELFDLLADNRRRSTIRRLDDRSDRRWRSVDELARSVATDELHTTERNVPEARIESVAEDLRETHLPRLAAAGIVRFDEAEAMVAAGPVRRPVADLIDRAGRQIDPTMPRERPYRSDWER